MWKTFLNNNGLYMIKATESENALQVYLTDLEQIWHQSLSEASILQRFQELNPIFDVKVEEATSQIIDLVNQISDNSEIDAEKSSTSIRLEIKLKRSSYEIKFTFDFNKADPDVFLSEVTVPLIQTIHNLEHQRKMLCNLIYRKDKEIEEYRMEKGDISRSDLVTEKFDENSIQINNEKAMINVFGNSEKFWDTLIEKHGNLLVKVLDIKREPWNVVKRKKIVYSSKTIKQKSKGVIYKKK